MELGCFLLGRPLLSEQAFEVIGALAERLRPLLLLGGARLTLKSPLINLRQ